MNLTVDVNAVVFPADQDNTRFAARAISPPLHEKGFLTAATISLLGEARLLNALYRLNSAEPADDTLASTELLSAQTTKMDNQDDQWDAGWLGDRYLLHPLLIPLVGV